MIIIKISIIDLNDEVILNNIYNIFNINDLINWLKIIRNKFKNIK